MKKEMIVVMSCVKDWYHYLLVDIYSLLECTPSVKKIYLLLETEDKNSISNLYKIEKKYNVEIVLINAIPLIERYLIKSCPNRDFYDGNICLGKMLLPSIIGEDKVLYIDTDAIVRRDISNIWKYNIDGFYLAGVRDDKAWKDGVIDDYGITGKYINSGVIVLNLKKMRDDNVVEKWFDVINTKRLKYRDQDAINIVCQNNEYYLPSFYNCTYESTYACINRDLIKIYNFVGDKTNWIYGKNYSEEWYDAQEKYFDEFGWENSFNNNEYRGE